MELLRDLCPYAVVTSRSRLSSEAFCYISGPHEMSPVVTIEFGTKCTEGLFGEDLSFFYSLLKNPTLHTKSLTPEKVLLCCFRA